MGDEIGPVVKGPLSHGDIQAFVAGSIGGLAHGLQLEEMKLHPSWGFTDPSTGSQEAIIRVHDLQEAAQKRTALEKTLIPETLETHLKRLEKIGFSVATCWFQCFNFVSILAIK